MPPETLSQWAEFVGGCDKETASEAVTMLAEKYFAAKERDTFTKAPTLWQFRKAVEDVTASRKKDAEMQNDCVLCDGEGNVIILSGERWDPSDPAFPPDPSWNIQNRKIMAIPCPICRWGEYRNRDFRERVRQRCRSNSRRNELLEVGI
jgi:hypothetical protein